jgi:hypothetical protein
MADEINPLVAGGNSAGQDILEVPTMIKRHRPYRTSDHGLYYSLFSPYLSQKYTFLHV